MQAARDDRQKYPDRAAKKYKEAAESYRQGGDRPRAALALLEADAKDPAPFIAAEAAAAQRKKNIEEAENNARVARRIEEGAFESGSCADLQVAANYYLDAAKFFLRADQFAVVNAVLLRKDHLERLLDEAKRKGLCSKELSARRTALVQPEQTPPERLPADQCRAILEHMRSVPEFKGAGGDALRVELASKGCKDTSAALTPRQCLRAGLSWSHDGVAREVIDRRLKLAGCPPL